MGGRECLRTSNLTTCGLSQFYITWYSFIKGEIRHVGGERL